MHYRYIVVCDADKADSSLEARQYVENFLDNSGFCTQNVVCVKRKLNVMVIMPGL